MEMISTRNEFNREISVPKPSVLVAKSVGELVKMVGEDLVLHYATSKITDAFRAMIRNKYLSKVKDKEGKYTETSPDQYTDNQILSENFSDWKPTMREKKDKQEIAFQALEKCSNEEIQDIMKKLKAQIKQG